MVCNISLALSKQILISSLHFRRATSRSSIFFSQDFDVWGKIHVKHFTANRQGVLLSMMLQ